MEKTFTDWADDTLEVNTHEDTSKVTLTAKQAGEKTILQFTRDETVRIAEYLLRAARRVDEE